MRDEKQLLLDEVKQKIEDSKGFVIARYQELTAARSREFRDKMAEAGGEFEVVKKRVFVKAAEKIGLKLDAIVLQGHIGIVFAHEDVMNVAKNAVKFSEDSNQVVTVLGGQIDGELCNAEEVEAIAKLPGLNELRAQFLGLLEAPMSQTIGAVQAILTSILYCLEEKSKKE